MIKFRYKRKEPTNVVGVAGPGGSPTAATTPPATVTPTKPATPPTNAAATSPLTGGQAHGPGLGPVLGQGHASTLHHHPQLSHLMANNGGGTLPRSSPRKLFLDGADKSATLTRQQSKPKSVSALAKVASSVELAVMGYNGASSGATNGGNINGNAERDRCINAVIVRFFSDFCQSFKKCLKLILKYLKLVYFFKNNFRYFKLVFILNL